MSLDFVELAAPGVRGLQPYQPGKPIEELERELGLDSVVKLASNENPLGPGERARAAARAATAELGRYPDGSGHLLRQALAEQLAVEPACLTLGNGSNDCLEMIARAFLTAEHEAVFSAHAFAVYPLATQAAGARARVCPARDYGHDLEAMAAAVGERTRVMFVANPNNPTGTWLERAAIERLLARVPEHCVVVLDEAYHEYVTVPGYASSVDLVARHRNLVVTRTFSKAHGLAGLRIGYAVSDPAIAELLNRVRQPFNVNAVALAAARAALEDQEHVARSRALNSAGLEQLGAGIAALGLEAIPSAGNFLTVGLPRPGAEVYRELLARGVIVRPVGGGYGLPRHLRVTVGLEAENARFLEALGEVLGDGR